MKKLSEIFSKYMKYLFNLDRDRIDPASVIEQIRSGIEFKGTNLWILIFAIFIASLGLNVNSTAVIIGAMLISPLMGPIMGVGLGLGINDFPLVRKSFQNLMIAYFIGLVASTLYFSISPVYSNHSELLARTTPTVYDVLIAFFGGLAGIVATSSKERGNVIPGVAIATALMPPLCTAGYGLSIGNFYYFLGAFYLLFINTVFICLATYLMLRFLRFPYIHYPDPKKTKRIRAWMILIVLVTFIPSVVIAWFMISKNIYEYNAARFISKELTFPKNVIISKNIDYQHKTIEVVYLGSSITPEMAKEANVKLPMFKLGGTKVTITNGFNDSTEALSSVGEGFGENLGSRNVELLALQNEVIQNLKSGLEKYNKATVDSLFMKEAKALFPTLVKASIAYTVSENAVTMKKDSIYLGYFTFTRVPSRIEVERLDNWLKARLNSNQIKLIVERN
jgi:uncharacterized hydrophobic protein (TIGR00271 family)